MQYCSYQIATKMQKLTKVNPTGTRGSPRRDSNQVEPDAVKDPIKPTIALALRLCFYCTRKHMKLHVKFHVKFHTVSFRNLQSEISRDFLNTIFANLHPRTALATPLVFGGLTGRVW